MIIINDTNTILFFATISLTFISLVLFIWFIINKSKRQYENLKNEYEKAVMAARLEMQEITLQHIAHELHDNVNNRLYLSKLQLDNLDFMHLDEARNTVRSSSVLIDKSIMDLRHISQALNNNTIRNLGLMEAVESEIHRYSLPGLFMTRIKFSGQVQPMRLKDEVSVFRIIQEAFSNIIKHSNANQVNFEMNYMDNYLDIKINDNGIGFDERILDAGSRGSGLFNMKLRVEMLNGHFELYTQENQGTWIHIVVPYENVNKSLLN